MVPVEVRAFAMLAACAILLSAAGRPVVERAARAFAQLPGEEADRFPLSNLVDRA